MGPKRRRVITWNELGDHTSVESLWISISGVAYDVTAWSKGHPGGQLVLMSIAGRDATAQFEAYHPQHVYRSLKNWEIGTMEPRPCFNSQVEEEFQDLKRTVEAAGLMHPSYTPYLKLLCFVGVVFASSLLLALNGRLVPSALLLALFWQQIAFVGHDLGHHAVTETSNSHALLGLLTNSFLGIGMSWWKSTHNVHHIVVNTADSDPDIQFMPLIAVSDHYFEAVWSNYHQDLLEFDSVARRLISWQHITFLPLLMIARFGLYLQTIKQLIHGKAYINRAAEVASQIFFFLWYGALVCCFEGFLARLGFVMLSHAVFFVLHLQICLSHFACKTTKNMSEASRCWMTHQVEGTMNWSCPEWMDWFHGGLQFQIEHHLFPRMPRQNLRAASKYVREACHRCGLQYHSPGFLEAIVETLQVLRSAALEARKRALPRQVTAVRKEAILSRAFM